MSLRIKVKHILNSRIKRLLPAYVTFGQNRNDRSGALFKAWGMALTNQLRGGVL